MRPEVLPQANRSATVPRPDFEQSIWLHSTADTPVDGDPPTPEAFANTYACLHNVTLHFLWTDGPWWCKTWGNLRDELDHWNSWQVYEAQQQPQTSDASAGEIIYPHLLAVSYRRLHALLETGDIDRWEYPLFIHLHELIREAALMAEEQPRFVGTTTPDPEPNLPPLYTQPVWELLHVPVVTEQPEHSQRVLDFSQPDATVKYGFTYEDLSEEPKANGARTITQFYFSNRNQATTIYDEHLPVIPYRVSALLEYHEGQSEQAVSLAEPWYPPAIDV